MWCVLKCHLGKAEEIMSSCRRNIPNDVLRDIFVFTYDRMKRYQGSWHVERYQMFPDYIFMETGDAAALSEHLKPYRNSSRYWKERTCCGGYSPKKRSS